MFEIVFNNVLQVAPLYSRNSWLTASAEFDFVHCAWIDVDVAVEPSVQMSAVAAFGGVTSMLMPRRTHALVIAVPPVIVVTILK